MARRADSSLLGERAARQRGRDFGSLDMDFSSTVEKVSGSIAKLYCFSDKIDVADTATGFLYLKKKMLVTCNHVIEGKQTITCRFPSDAQGVFHSAKVVMQDAEHDLALLRVEVDLPPLAALTEKSQSEVRAGMPVLFSGYPLNLETLTTHQGILSAITKDLADIKTYLIDGTVNSGNSGCPMMNSKGEVIGVVNAKRRERSDLLAKVEAMTYGAISLHGIDLVEIYQALISNVQLGIGYAVPASFIPSHKEESSDASKALAVTKPAKKSVKSKK